jgi:D-xylose transport system permease protein
MTSEGIGVPDSSRSALPVSELTRSGEKSLQAYLKDSLIKIRSGQSGLAPILLGLVVLAIFFQTKNSLFLSVGNLTNLLTQASYLIMFGFAEIWILLLGEIDLSAGYNGAIGGALMAVYVGSYHNFPWWVAIICALAASSMIGALVGALVIRLRIPSFIVSLAFLLSLQGVLLKVVNLDNYQGSVSISNGPILDLVNGNLSRVAGWILYGVCVGLLTVVMTLSDARKRRSGSEGVPVSITIFKVVSIAAGGLLLVLVCNANRGVNVPLSGIPFCVPIVLGVLFLWNLVLTRSRFGRYVYAIGGNAEAARRAGIRLGSIRMAAFTLTGLTAGIAGILYTSRLGGSSTSIDGGQLVLLAVAAAVIGGVSLFGGRGKMVHALIGGLIISVIYNGMGLIGLDAATQDIVIGLVLLSAVGVEAISRRSSSRS